jgi:hypothetical protein
MMPLQPCLNTDSQQGLQPSQQAPQASAAIRILRQLVLFKPCKKKCLELIRLLEVVTAAASTVAQGSWLASVRAMSCIGRGCDDFPAPRALAAATAAREAAAAGP